LFGSRVNMIASIHSRPLGALRICPILREKARITLTHI